MNNNAIRHQLQLKARELLTQFHQCSKTDRIALTALAAAIECYLEIRKQLAPYIATDGYMQELAGLTFKIGATIKQLDNPPAQPSADAGQQFYSVMVRVESMDCLGTSAQICDTFVLVQAPNPQAASKAAVAWHSEHPVVHADDLDGHSQSSFTHCDRAGHTSWDKSRGIRYSSIVVLSLSPDDAFHFKCMTTGLMNARLVTA